MMAVIVGVLLISAGVIVALSCSTEFKARCVCLANGWTFVKRTDYDEGTIFCGIDPIGVIHLICRISKQTN